MSGCGPDGDLLATIKPLHVTEESQMFLNQEGEPINFHTRRARIWYRALRAQTMRERKPYTMRHTIDLCGTHQRR
jgi:site-specific recombinase XerD